MLCYILNPNDWNLDLIFFFGCIFFSAFIFVKEESIENYD